MPDHFSDVAQFYRETIGLPIPSEPTMLNGPQVASAYEHWMEEASEFLAAETIEDQIDACVDLAWLAIGRIIEMGADPDEHFAEVVRANLTRSRGRNPKRPNSTGYDAVKPEGWKGPDHRAILEGCSARRRHIDSMRPPVALLPAPVPTKVLLLGHARHGKDTVAEMLRDRHGYSFASSSMFCCERIVLPHFKAIGSGYDSAEACYEDRVNHRALWYDLISGYNVPDASRLAREMLEENDLYVGMRSAREFEATRGLFDHVVWVERPGTPFEGRGSFDIDFHPHMLHIQNGGSLEDLAAAVDRLAQRIGDKR